MEIERKFLTKELPFDITAYPCKAITQAYLSFSPTIRIRRSNADYILTVKGKGHLAREEFELPLSEEEYNRLSLKTDIYEGKLQGLMTTEVEFSSVEAAEKFVAPTWFGRDVSEEKAYKNTSLSLYGIPKEL